MKRYILFMRPVGSCCWTMVMKASPIGTSRDIPAQFSLRENAERYAERESKRYDKVVDFYIAEVELPE